MKAFALEIAGDLVGHFAHAFLNCRAANQYFQFFLARSMHDFSAPAWKAATLSQAYRIDKTRKCKAEEMRIARQ